MMIYRIGNKHNRTVLTLSDQFIFLPTLTLLGGGEQGDEWGGRATTAREPVGLSNVRGLLVLVN